MITASGEVSLDFIAYTASTPLLFYRTSGGASQYFWIDDVKVVLLSDEGASYGFGFNGKENDNEVSGVGNSLDFGARIYDSRLGRWFKPDPLAKLYAPYSPYNFALNSPIQAKDVDGRLVIYANGLRFDASLMRGLLRLFKPWRSKLGDDNNFENGEGVYRDYKQIDSKEGYWEEVLPELSELLHDDNNFYVDGTNRWYSGEIRYREGEEAAMTLHKMIETGQIVLKPGETIKLVGHSQGARYAAGMAAKLIELGHPVEQIYYIAPHQPDKIKHPKGLKGRQFSRQTDAISSTGLIPTFISRSHFGLIDGENSKWIQHKILPNIDKFFGAGGFRGHLVETYKGLLGESTNPADNYDVRPQTPEEKGRNDG